jgi:cob(I)alamin adenosyltransferase
MKIYTKTGDDGTTFDGSKRVPKYDCSMDGQGEIDELNAWIGMIRERIMDVPFLEKIQKDLMEAGAQLATNDQRITEEDIEKLESCIDLMESDLPKLKNFIIPKSTPEIHCLACRYILKRQIQSCYPLP